MKDKKGAIMIIETERLVLKEMSLNDVNGLSDVLLDPDVMRYYPYPFTYDDVLFWINRNIERYQIFGFGLWGVFLKETNEMIGDCGLTMQIIDEVIKPEIGYHIKKSHQRKGYAKEAAIAVRDYAFSNTPFKTIYSYMLSDNIPSIKTAKSYGCHEVYEYNDEKTGSHKVFAITRDEWMMIKYLGKEVTVKVDRPKGSCHPTHHDIFYPINYGYVEGIMALDNEWQDAYILGVNEPVECFTGNIIAIIERLDDVEQKWVVAPKDSCYTEEEILKHVFFQEQFFKIKIHML